MIPVRALLVCCSRIQPDAETIIPDPRTNLPCFIPTDVLGRYTDFEDRLCISSANVRHRL